MSQRNGPLTNEWTGDILIWSSSYGKLPQTVTVGHCKLERTCLEINKGKDSMN